MLRPSVQTAVCLLAGLVLLLSACGEKTPGTPSTPPPTGFARVAVDPEGSRPEVMVMGVAPRPGVSPWGGAVVMLDYSRLKGDVDLERSWLYVDGRRRPARVTWTALTPVSFVVIFAWRWPVRPGTHTLRAHLGTTGGGSVSYEWTTVTR
jgi:hypothetical protein